MAKKKENFTSANWMLTYSDMVTLLLVFFVLFVTITKNEVIKTKLIISALTGNLGFLQGGNTVQETDNTFVTLGNTVQNLTSEDISKQKLNRSIDKSFFQFDSLQESKKVRVIENNEGIIITLFSDVFFEANSAELNFEAIKEVLERVRQLIDRNQFDGEILINGHTDSTPYQGSSFQDNWELSSARAYQVFLALRQIPYIYPIDTSKISIHGYGDSKPIESNNTPQGRAYNRRVDIYLKR